MLLTLSELTGHLDLDNIENLTVLQASGPPGVLFQTSFALICIYQSKGGIS